MPRSILITGGAGFVGAALALAFKRDEPESRVVAFDNLKRRGSELNLGPLKRAGVEFIHGDIRSPADLEDVPGRFDLFLEASAEPSVHAGTDGNPNYVLHTNLTGTLHCLELARRRAGLFVFLSTSRVYSIEPLREIALRETESRFEAEQTQSLPGVGPEGVTESFPTHLPRSFYGASKLASEMVLQEYAAACGLPALINRCGVIAGPGQFGKVDQGVFTFWVAAHHFGRPLRYTGFGGTGKQVRDLLHPEDLYALLRRQSDCAESPKGEIFNVGGGRGGSLSLRELTALCREATGNEVPVEGDTRTSAVDVPYYVSDTARVRARYGWAPRHGPASIVTDTARWITANEPALRPLFAP